jgi:hypothetical protein
MDNHNIMSFGFSNGTTQSSMGSAINTASVATTSSAYSVNLLFSYITKTTGTIATTSTGFTVTHSANGGTYIGLCNYMAF